ncbi:MAG: hypothetical protein R6V54_00465 [Desulfobacteraceae bacterium]
MPYTFFKKFKEACKKDRKNIFVWKSNVLPDAEEYFKLKTEKDLLDFIANDGLEDLVHINTTPWKKNPKPENEIKVYAYNFRTMCILGYIAIMRNLMTKKWVLKSLKHSGDSNNSLGEALGKALLSIDGRLK